MRALIQNLKSLQSLQVSQTNGLSDFYLHTLAWIGLAMSSVSLFISGSPTPGFIPLLIIGVLILIRRKLNPPSANALQSWILCTLLVAAVVGGAVHFWLDNNPSLAMNVMCATLLAVSSSIFFAERLYLLGAAYHFAIMTAALGNFLSPMNAAWGGLGIWALVKCVIFLNRLELKVKER